jgi:phosphoribosyl-ATP pyrophosphohydrolase
MSDSLERLYHAINAAKDLDPATSRTARLFQRGPAKMAKKLAEEAIEVVIDAVGGDSEAVVRESADLLYNLSVLWVAAGVRPEDVWAEMDRREKAQGIAEKLPKAITGKTRSKMTPDELRAMVDASITAPSASENVARRPIVALQGGRLKKRR